MNEIEVIEIVKDFGEACQIMGEAYANRQNTKGNKARAKAIAYYKRFAADRELFEKCMDILLENENIDIVSFSADVCLSLNYREEDAVKILTSIRDRSIPDYNSIGALMTLSDYETKGKVVICEAKEINGTPGVPISTADIYSYTDYIRQQVGDYEKVYMELTNKFLPIDIIVVPPAEGRDCYTLVTMGSFYYKMPAPDYYESMNRAEYVLRLPSDWKIDDQSKEWQWPMEALRTLARVPCMEKSWLGWYHDVKFKRGFSKLTQFTGFVLDVFDEDSEPLVLENGDKVILYNAIPIYPEELDYCLKEGGKKFVEMMDNTKKSAPLDTKRARIV